MVEEDREKRWMPDRDEAEVRALQQVCERSITKGLKARGMTDVSGDSHRPVDDAAGDPSQVFAILLEPDRNGGVFVSFVANRGTDGPVCRTRHDPGIGMEQIDDPRTYGGGEFLLELPGVWDELAAAGRAAGGGESDDPIGREDMLFSAADSIDIGIEGVVVANRNTGDEIIVIANSIELMLAAERGLCGIAHEPGKNGALGDLRAPEGSTESPPRRQAAHPPRGISDQCFAGHAEAP